MAAKHPAFAIDEGGHRHPHKAKRLRHPAFRVEINRQAVDAELFVEGLHDRKTATIERKRKNDDVLAGKQPRQAIQGRQLAHARPAPRRPEIENDALPSPIGKAPFPIFFIVEDRIRHWPGLGKRRKVQGRWRRKVGRRAGKLPPPRRQPGANGNRPENKDQTQSAGHGNRQFDMKTKSPPVTDSAPPLRQGRFDQAPDITLETINASIGFDKRLYAQDIAGSKAHCAMLVATGILAHADGEAILKGLEQIDAEIQKGEFEFKAELEDIHMHIEARLRKLIGETAGKLHTARSRNDQVATDFRLWVREAVDIATIALRELQAALLDRAEEHAETLLPGFTHLQAAQPVSLGHHLLAYVEMFGRDRGRLEDCRRRLNESPLGAAALAGTSFPIDREMTAATLGFDRPMANSMDAVSDRDFALEYLSAAAITATHLSRLAEEIILWSSTPFGFIRLSDAFSTGSSIMPQKRNPDAAELVRGKAGRVLGALTTLLVVMKGLPLTYSKDMQEDKEPVFDTTDTLLLCLAVMTGMVRDLTVDRERMLAAAGAGYTTATDLSDWLVRTSGLAFRDAHRITGEIVKLAEKKGVGLEELPLKEMQRIEARITNAVFDVLSVTRSVESRTSAGGTAPARVREAVRQARSRFL